MKVIIAGSRTFNNFQLLIKHIMLFQEQIGEITEVVSGTARGADKLGEQWAIDSETPIKRFPANWNKHGRSAGYRRNEEMAEYADALIAFQENNSKGTEHMINIATNKGLPCYIVRISR